jgi:hypothetical protein
VATIVAGDVHVSQPADMRIAGVRVDAQPTNADDP